MGSGASRANGSSHAPNGGALVPNGRGTERVEFEIEVTCDDTKVYLTSVPPHQLKNSLQAHIIVPFCQQLVRPKGTRLAISFVEVNGVSMDESDLKQPLKAFVVPPAHVEGEKTRVLLKVEAVEAITKRRTLKLGEKQEDWTPGLKDKSRDYTARTDGATGLPGEYVGGGRSVDGAPGRGGAAGGGGAPSGGERGGDGKLLMILDEILI